MMPLSGAVSPVPSVSTKLHLHACLSVGGDEEALPEAGWGGFVEDCPKGARLFFNTTL